MTIIKSLMGAMALVMAISLSQNTHANTKSADQQLNLMDQLSPEELYQALDWLPNEDVDEDPLFNPAGGRSIRIQVSKARQRMYVYVDGVHWYTWKVSTGKTWGWDKNRKKNRSFRTPRGTWRPTRMYRMWHSRSYNMTPMPYSIFYYRGFAIHGTAATHKLGRRASKGCVRLHTRNARTLYFLVRPNRKRTRITVY